MGALEKLALRLAALYAQVLVQAALTGRFGTVPNHAEILQTWEALAQSLWKSTMAEDQITPMVLDAVAKHLRDPTKVLHSLGHDCPYAALVSDCYAHLLGILLRPVHAPYLSFSTSCLCTFTSR